MAWPPSNTLYLLTLIILLQTPLISAKNTSSIPVGRSLTATVNDSSWLSPLNSFAFGFTKYSNSSKLFLLAIWYAKIIPITIVWHANDGIPVPQGSSVRITATAGLVLSNPEGISLWNTSDELSDGNEVSYGFLYDTGNFVLKRSSSDDDVVWQSFDHPTDTLLPTQSMEIDGVVYLKLSETNFTKGRFQLNFELRDDIRGNLILNSRDLTTGFGYGAYYNSGILGQRLVYNASGYMFILRNNGSRQDLLPPYKVQSTKDKYQRATLNFYGVLTWYSIPKTSISGRWSVIHALPENICTIYLDFRPDISSGICGFNSICSLDDDSLDRRPTCTCPNGYSFLDPHDEFGSCKPDFTIDSCGGSNADRSMKGEYSMLHLANTDWPWNDYQRLDPCSDEDCRNSCQKDCFCAAAMYGDINNPAGCWKKKAPLSNGRRDRTVIGKAWIKVGNVSTSNNLFNTSVSFSPSPAKNKVNSLTKALIGGFGSVNILLLSAVGFGIFIYHKRKLKVSNEVQRKTMRKYCSIVHCFSYQELTEATNGFREELGRGAFGVVYKGLMINGGGSICVAVKKLDRISKDADKEFEAELNVIGQTHHKNLVRFIGFCKEEDQRLLVYEYMSNGTVEDYLFGDVRPSWTARVQIAQNTAEGLLYLHEECSRPIIHCDIKPQNILLDEYQNARISDFGLAKLLILNQTHTNTAIRGTKGYVAPEWFRNKPVTVKVDVYSFGVLLLEIICCRKSVCMELVEEEAAILTDWAFDCFLSNRFDSLDNDDMEALNDIIRLKRLVMIALWCIQEDPSLRPTMRAVTQMLDGLVEVPKNPPCPTSFSVITQN